MKYVRNGMNYYECEEAKFRQKIVTERTGHAKYAQAGDWICYPINEKNERVGQAFIAQPEDFFTNFKKVE